MDRDTAIIASSGHAMLKEVPCVQLSRSSLNRGLWGFIELQPPMGRELGTMDNPSSPKNTFV
jgi:hypothetical protein